MAGKVNKNFIITLVAGLAGVFVLMALAYVFLLKNSAADLALEGDRRMTQGQYDKAQEYFSKAVNKEQTNADYLVKWRESLLKLAPENVVTYRDMVERWRLATRQLAKISKKDVAPKREYLDWLREDMTGMEFSRQAHESLIGETTSLLTLHKGDPAGGEWETLRRFRGLAKMEVFAFVEDSRPEVAAEAQDDLLAAMGADPADTESAVVLRSLHLVQAARAQKRSQLDEEKALLEKAKTVLAQAVERNPSDAFIHLVALEAEVNARSEEFRRNQRGADPLTWMRTLQSDLRPAFVAMVDKAKATDPAKINTRLIDGVRRMEAIFSEQEGKFASTMAVIDRGLTGRPNDPFLIAARADVEVAEENLAAAVASVQKILDLPVPPTSLTGLRLFAMRNNARFYQALWTARMAAGAKEADKPGLTASAKSLREKLAAVEAPDSPSVLFVDAQIAFVDADFGRANQLLDRYAKAVRSRPSPDALLLHAAVAEKLNQLGLAKSKLEECLRLDPRNPRGLYALADVTFRLQEIDEALNLYLRLGQMLPEDRFVKGRIEVLRQLAGDRSAPPSDPVLADLIELRDMVRTREGEKDRTAEAVPFLQRRVAERNQDPRLAQQLALLLMGEGKRDAALATLRTSLAVHPAATDLKDLEIALSNPDPVAGRIQLIDSKTDGTPIEKALAKYQVLKEAGQAAEATAQLAAAAGMDATDERVVEMQFLDAMEASDWTKAQQFADVATKANHDQVGGLTFRARLLGAQGKTTEALAAITEAVGRGGAVPEVWRIKGRIEMSLRRQAEAAESYRQALRLRPSDVGAINDALVALVSNGLAEEALKLAKESERYAASDAKFVDMWLSLEAAAGSKRFAIDRREVIARTNPKDRMNLIALTALYIGDRNWAKARPLIDRARALQDGTDVLTLDARWHWEQGEREKARSLFEGYLKGQPQDSLTSYPFLVYAQFLATQQDDESALTVLEQARAKQDPKSAEADKAIVELLMKNAKFEQAASVCRRIVTANADDAKQTHRLRLVECLVKVGNMEDAQKELTQMGAAAEADPMSMLLAADIKAGLKDVRGQKDMLDRAVTRFPDNPLVFFKRGQALAADARTAREAISDFNKAVQLRPDMWQAYRMRATAHIMLNQMTEAEADLTQAVLLAPYNDELFMGLVSDFIRKGDYTRAADVAMQVLAKRDRDVNAMATVASLFMSVNAYVEAARFFKMAFDIEKSDMVAQRYLDALLAATPPNNTEANVVLNGLGDQRIAGSPGFLMAVSKLAKNTGRLAEANAAANEALKLLRVDEPTMMLAWFNDLRRLLPRKDELLRYLDQAGRLSSAAKAQEWIAYFRLAANLEDPTTVVATLPAAKDLLSKAEEPSIRQLLYRSVSGAQIAQGEHAEAVRTIREALGSFPSDVEMLNNGAYCLAEKLGKPQDAVAMIEKAVELTPGVADVWDTYGSVFLRLEQYEKAADGFGRAVRLAGSPSLTIKYATPLVESLVKAGRKEQARSLLRDLRTIVDDSRNQIDPDLRSRFDRAAALAEGAG
jgi:tetratricopeptide (TPR) repeat protein